MRGAGRSRVTLVTWCALHMHLLVDLAACGIRVQFCTRTSKSQARNVQITRGFECGTDKGVVLTPFTSDIK